MKKNTIASKMFALTMAVGLLAFSGAYAQEQQVSTESGMTAKFGIKGGLNLTNLYVADVSSEHIKAGFNAGVYAKLPVTRAFPSSLSFYTA